MRTRGMKIFVLGCGNMIRGCSGHVESKGAGILVAVTEMLSQKTMTPPHICIVNSCHPGHT